MPERRKQGEKTHRDTASPTVHVSKLQGYVPLEAIRVFIIMAGGWFGKNGLAIHDRQLYVTNVRKFLKIRTITFQK